MEQSRFWKANRSSASQEISRILWKPEVHYHIHKRLPPVPILSQINPVRAPHPTSWRSIVILSLHLRLGLPNCLFSSYFPSKTRCTLFCYPYVLRAPPITFFSIWSPELCLMRSLVVIWLRMIGNNMERSVAQAMKVFVLNFKVLSTAYAIVVIICITCFNTKPRSTKCICVL